MTLKYSKWNILATTRWIMDMPSTRNLSLVDYLSKFIPGYLNTYFSKAELTGIGQI